MHLLDHAQISALLASYGYGLILVAVALESAGVPMPGETILVSAAVYAGTTHNLAIAGVIAAAATGAVVGDNVGFWVGREAGQPILERFGDFVGLDARRRKLGQYLFRRYGGAIVFFGRFVAFLRAFAALLAGVNRLEPLRFFVFNAAGGVAWATIFGLGGYALGASFHRIAGPFGPAMLALAVAARAGGGRFYRHHEERLLDEAERAMDARGPA